MRKRITTGNSGLDGMIYGGIPEGNNVLVAGGAGAGKTLTGVEFLYKNALKGDNGLFISLEETESAIINNAEDAFTDFHDLRKLFEEQKITIYEHDLASAVAQSGSKGERRYEFSKLMADVIMQIQKTKAKRVVIDSVSVFKLLLNDELDYRALTISLLGALRKNNTTSLSTLEMQSYASLQYMFYPEFFLYDGLIMLHSASAPGNAIPSLQVMKMRGTDHSFQNVPYKITSGGMKVAGSKEK